MTIDVGGSFNQLESRLAALEQRTLTSVTGLPSMFFDPDTGESVLEDPLDWTLNPTGWEPFSTISPLVEEVDGEVTGGELSTEYGRPEAHMVGNMCVLTGLVRRKAGATPSTMSPGARYNSVMFGLPSGWRPVVNTILPCLTGNAAPGSGTTVSTAWIEIRPEVDLEQLSGRVYFVAGTGTIQPTTGWVALQGVFPCQIVQPDDEDVEVEVE